MVDIIYARYGLCSNADCKKVHEMVNRDSSAAPAFCTECKYPLVTACISCEYLFDYHPSRYCGMCSAGLFENDSVVNYIRYAAVLLRGRDLWTEEAHSVLRRLAVYFPFLQNYESLDIDSAFRNRGLDTLLEPPPEKPKGPFLKLV